MSDTFQAVWPIHIGAGHANLTDAELIEDALTDLPNVAARHGVKLTGRPQVAITHGSQFPGVAHTAQLIVAECPAQALPRRKGEAA